MFGRKADELNRERWTLCQ